MAKRLMKLLMAVLAAALALSMGLLYYHAARVRAAWKASGGKADVLIDPGHGGEDGGAVAADGTLEKNIDLAVALDLRDMLRICGYRVAMTRETDVSIHDADAVGARQKKVSDMQKRLALYREAEAVLSVHANHFSVPKYRGAQMFYSGNHPDGARLAEHIRQSIVSGVQPDNRRELKKATDGIYLLYHTQTPAVLVECGFLSNPEECALLCRPDYRQRMAAAIAFGFVAYAAEP